MGKLIGALFGLLLGKGIDDGVFVTFALAVAGFVAGVVVDRQRAAQREAPGPDLAARLAAVERRLDALERDAYAARGGVPGQEAAARPDAALPRETGGAAIATAST